MAPRRRCPTCGSKQWHKEPSSGLIACSEGHILQNYRNENTEMEEMGPHAVKKRTIKSNRKKKEVGSNADPKLYHGARGRYFYFLCLQLILRKQVAALVKLWHFPPEFEVIARDVWALNLSLLPNIPEPEPYIYAQATRDAGVVSEDPPNLRNTPAPTPDASSPAAVNGGDSSSDEEPEQAQNDDDPEIDELMRELSEVSSSSDEEADGESAPKASGRNDAKPNHVYEGPSSTIAVLVVACWILRIPILYRDFSRIIESYDLPYLDPVRLLPQSMVSHLTKQKIQALSPHYGPNTLAVHALASRLAKRLYSTYGVFTPEANAAPILWRVIKAMGGTPTLYNLTKRLSHLLSLPLTLHSSLAPGLKVIKSHDPERHKYDSVPPEVAMMATCIIVLKMVYGFDGKTRLPREAGDPATSLPRIDEYLKVLKAMNEAEEKTCEASFNSKKAMSVGDLTDEMIDEYIVFCEKALLRPGDEEEDTTLGRYFPLRHGPRRDDIGSGGDVRETRGPLAATLVHEEEEGDKPVLRPGEMYAIWNARDVHGTLPVEYERVLERGAGWVGVGVESLGGVIEMYERRLLRWWEREKRRSRVRVDDGDDDIV